MSEIVLAAPYCSPHRGPITQLMAQYGITSARIVDAYTLGETGLRGDEHALEIGGRTPVRQVFHVRVSPDAAIWAEYIALRTNKYELLSKPHDARNARWAAKWDGAMPKPWLVGECASRVQPPPKTMTMKEDSAGAQLLRQLRRITR